MALFSHRSNPHGLLTALGLSLALLGARTAQADSSSWSLDPAHSEVGFSVKHMMVTNVRGKFTKFDGTVTLDEKDVTKSKVEVSIDVASIDTGVGDRDQHLRSPDFFNAEKNPKLTFTSTKVQKAGKGLKVTGDLTINGVTKPVTLSVSEVTKEGKDPWGNVKRGASASTEISRKDFGLTWNKALETGGVLVGDEVKITLELELLKKS